MTAFGLAGLVSYLKLIIGPGVKRSGAHKADVHTKAPMDPSTGETNIHSVGNRGPSRILGWAIKADLEQSAGDVRQTRAVECWRAWGGSRSKALLSSWWDVCASQYHSSSQWTRRLTGTNGKKLTRLEAVSHVH